jgi:ubiquinone/menaquinone biosynthesis C-methylase UbiE
MLNRRTLFGIPAAFAALFTSAVPGRRLAAKSTTSFDVEPRGSIGRMERLPSLDLESQQDFLTGFRSFVNSDLRKASLERFETIMTANGIAPDTVLPQQQVLDLVKDDPVIATSVRTWLSGQQITWKSIQDEFHNKSDMYLAEMAAADRSGPGSVELNPDMEIPDYARHEIHIQPGGYVGDAFAGHINHYGVNAFYQGRNYQDEVQAAIAANVMLPPDGKVKRILDLGCATGRLTFAMKERFPDAEVWGIDVGGPMVRYAHLRGIDLGLDVHFAQRLAEDTRFPDGYFDLVVSYILFHEVPQAITQQIAPEAFRVLRPGGAFFPIDFRTGKQASPMTPYRRFAFWWDHRWNNEVWRPEFASADFGDTIASAGFEVDETIPSARRGHGAIYAVKPA